MTSLVIHAWTLYEFEEKYFLPYSHWIYLKEIIKHHSSVCILSPVIITNKDKIKNYYGIDIFNNVSVHKLPASTSYLSATKYFFHYVSAYKKIINFDRSYVRYPVPFGWLQRLFFKRERIIHYVGDPIDTILKNNNFSLIRKILYTTFFLPEYISYLWASKGNVKVFTNGIHLSKKLKKYGIKALPLTSTTLSNSDFYFEENKIISEKSPRIIYLGYLRKAKGVETVINSFSIFQKNFPNSKLSIVGDGEMRSHLQTIINEKKINNVTFHGHIDDREELNKLLRSSDIFCFCSLSEGSPRVIIEAMANGLNVVTTPVGSLPYIFENNKDILFSNFNDAEGFSNKMISLVSNSVIANNLRNKAFKKVKKMTLDKFIEEIFNES